MSLLNILDSLASTGVLIMGEGAEQTPIAIVQDIDNIEFGNIKLAQNSSLEMDKDLDIFAPLLKSVKWKKGGSKK